MDEMIAELDTLDKKIILFAKSKTSDKDWDYEELKRIIGEWCGIAPNTVREHTLYHFVQSVVLRLKHLSEFDRFIEDLYRYDDVLTPQRFLERMLSFLMLLRVRDGDKILIDLEVAS